ncbi:hypothetical protein [Enterococcus faecium]|uniref:hypothetical protein n=1 Tax=Enterococcus faecium TaxID=1352 RepID=UPI0021FE2F0C|nr:hypothetical protein [Enterococcus faecium]BDP92869.1 hypothetical protein EfmGK923_30420 [Enterococcus faecium]BDP96061.1 hypothetical protein EfmGK941_30660 [Enterococcus faecium]BDP99247.1 hypothetical protein EfmGK961_30630 [Enterococcus faecium]
MTECKYCNPTEENEPYGKPMEMNFDQITTKVDGLNGCLSMYGTKDSDMVLINYCPMCGRDISEGH